MEDGTDRAKLKCNGGVKKEKDAYGCNNIEWPYSTHGHGGK
jgi:hypothetical protein